MKKLLVFLLIFLIGTAGFAESQDIELSSYVGRPFEELYNDIGGEMDIHHFPDGITVYLHWMIVSARYTYDDADIKYGWGDDIVFSITVSDAGYSLFGIKVGDSEESVIARCEADGWTVMEEPPKYCDGGYEKIVDNVRYELGYIIEYGTDYINCVSVDAENMAGTDSDGGFLDWLTFWD